MTTTTAQQHNTTQQQTTATTCTRNGTIVIYLLGIVQLMGAAKGFERIMRKYGSEDCRWSHRSIWVGVVPVVLQKQGKNPSNLCFLENFQPNLSKVRVWNGWWMCIAEVLQFRNGSGGPLWCPRLPSIVAKITARELASTRIGLQLHQKSTWDDTV